MQVGDMVVIRTENARTAFGTRWVIAKDMGDKCELRRYNSSGGILGNGRFETLVAEKIMLQLVPERSSLQPPPPQGGSSSARPDMPKMTINRF